jgi:hypothetical protein
MGRVESQQVVEGGGMYKCAGGITIVYSVAASFT